MDVVAALRPAAIEVQIGEWVYEIPPFGADVWIEAVISNDAFQIVPGLFGEDDEADVLDLLAFAEIDIAEILPCARHALEAAAGRPWYTAQHLIIGAADAWDSVGGNLLLRGVKIEDMSIGAFCSAVYALATRDMKKEDRLKLDMNLSRVPVDAVEEEMGGEEGAAAAFRAALAEATRRG